MTWDQAEGECAAMSGDLLAIHSPEEQNFVTSLISDKPMPYIGLTMNNTLMRLVLITHFRVLKILCNHLSLKRFNEYKVFEGFYITFN
jgi:hypothetical protein